MAKTTLKISHPHLAPPKTIQKTASTIATTCEPVYAMKPTVLDSSAAPSFQSFLQTVAPVPPSKPLPATPAGMKAAPAQSTSDSVVALAPIERATPRKPRPSSSVYISRTSGFFEPMMSTFDSKGNRIPSTDFFLQPARYSYGEGVKVPEVETLKTSEKFEKLFEERNRLRESVDFLSSIIREEHGEEDRYRPMTYMPALEKVYHNALNHELEEDFTPTPQEDDFPSRDNFDRSEGKATAVMGLEEPSLHIPQLFPHEMLSPRPSPSTFASSTPESTFTTSSRSSYSSSNSSQVDIDYHDLLAEQAKETKMMQSEANVKAEMRLVPQPLFFGSKHKKNTPSHISANSTSDRFHEGLFTSFSSKKLPAKPTVPSKLLSPRRPFIHESKPAATSSSSTSFHVSSLYNSAIGKAKGGLATLSSLAEGLESNEKNKLERKAEMKRADLKRSIQVVGPCDANAQIVAERLKSVPLGMVGIGGMF